MKAIEIAKEYFTDADEEFLDFIIWSETGFPSFWQIPEDGNDAEECFRKQLQEAKEKYGCVKTLDEVKGHL